MTKAISRETANHCSIDKWNIDLQKPKNKRVYAWIGVKGKKGREFVVLIEKKGIVKRLVAYVKWLFGIIKTLKPNSAFLEKRKLQTVKNTPLNQVPSKILGQGSDQSTDKKIQDCLLDLSAQTEEKSPSKKLCQEILHKKGFEEKSPLAAESKLIDLAIEIKVPKTDQEIESFANVVLKTKEEMRLQIIQQQYQKLSDLLIEKFGETRAKEIVFDSNLFPEFKSQEFEPLTQDRVDQILMIAENYYFNVEAFKRLDDSLTKIAGKDISEKILSNVKVFDQRYFVGNAKLTDELFKKAEALALELKSYAPAEEIIEKIKQACRSWMPIDEKIIEHKFHLSKVLVDLPDDVKIQMKTDLHKELMQLFLKKRLKEPHKLISPKLKMDARILDACKLKSHLTKEEERLGFLTVCKEVLEQELHQLEVVSGKIFGLDEYRTRMKKHIYKRCLTTLGVPNEQTLNKYLALKSMILQEQQDRVSKKESWMNRLPDTFPKQQLPIAAKMYEERLTAIQLNRVEALLLEHFSSSCRALLSDASISIEMFESQLGKVKESINIDLQYINKKSLEILEKRNDYLFLDAYGQYVVRELMQGYELNEEGKFTDNFHLVNGDGVCWAKNRNLSIASFKDPETPLKQFPLASQINPRDRFLQADNLMKSKMEGDIEKINMISDQTLKDLGLKGYCERRFLMKIKPDKDALDRFIRSFTDELDKLNSRFKNSHGWIHFSISFSDKTNGGHALAIRVDEEHHSYALYDSNFGLIDFSTFDKEAAKTHVYTCLQDLIMSFYPNTVFIAASQIAK